MARNRTAYQRRYRKANRQKLTDYKREYRQENGYEEKKPTPVIGIDGEGLQDENGRHIYRYLAACTENDCINEVENPKGIAPEEAFEFLFAIKRYFNGECLIIGFSLNYDYSKWFEGLPDNVIYHLSRPETRKGRYGAKGVRWKWYYLNYLRGRFSVTRLLPGQHRRQCNSENCPGCKHGETVVVWDVWGFYQGSFIDACKNWKVIGEAEYEQLRAMKARRSTFTEAQWDTEVKPYCQLECKRAATLVRRLRESHSEAGLPLNTYYGAGSTATVLMGKMGIKEHLPQEVYPEDLKIAIAHAFFGGRFEISQIGPYMGQVYSYDIASAYPYQLYQLPCLACGKWRYVTEKVEKTIEKVAYGFVQYDLPPTKKHTTEKGWVSKESWGPFPFRTKGLVDIDDGCIIYPVTSGGGWTGVAEFKVARKHWKNVKAKAAWIYETDCGHHPFKGLSDIYLERLRWGKDGPGIVLKLGPNSCYGKIAQTIGDNPPFQCFAWAAWITSGTRAQLLELMTQDLDAILMTATDGIVSKRPLTLPEPVDTGTREGAAKYGKPPLGAWEAKTLPSGVHMIRPGIAFPLVDGEGDGPKETKARGVGKAVLKNHRDLVLESWREKGPQAITLQSTIFRGMKSSTGFTQGKYKRVPEYGQWVPRETAVSYIPEPKRPFVVGEGGKLSTWALPKECFSAPYGRILGVTESLSLEAAALKELELMMSEQPDREESHDEF